jgi:hypothetical protein
MIRDNMAKSTKICDRRDEQVQLSIWWRPGVLVLVDIIRSCMEILTYPTNKIRSNVIQIVAFKRGYCGTATWMNQCAC